MPDAEYSAKIYAGTLYVNWESSVPLPESEEAVAAVAGSVEADRD